MVAERRCVIDTVRTFLSRKPLARSLAIRLIRPDLDPDNDKRRVFGGAGNDTITTGDDADFIDGGDGTDHNHTPASNDDTVIGGAGDDFISRRRRQRTRSTAMTVNEPFYGWVSTAVSQS